MQQPIRRLLVVSHVLHYRHQGQLYAYGPYVREIDIWADLFPELLIASPCRDEPPPGDALPFSRRNIAIVPQPEAGGDTASAKLRLLLAAPKLVGGLALAMRGADAVHVRCPGNLGALGALVAPLFSRYRVAKYAGQWNGYAGEPLSMRFQRALLGSRWWGAPVTVYGAWPGQPEQVVPFFTSMMTSEQVRHAQATAERRQIGSPLRVLFSGRLDPAKRVAALLEAVGIAAGNGVALEVVIVGDGPQRDALEAQARELGLATRVRFVGALPYEQALAWYEWGDCLVLPSTNSEGWPKVIAEAMCYGLVCVAVAHGQVPAMLETRGVVLAHGTAGEIAGALTAIAADPAAFRQMTQDAATWSQRYTLEGLRDALRALLGRAWPDAAGERA